MRMPVGTVFSIPLEEGGVGYGQVLFHSETFCDAYPCALWPSDASNVSIRSLVSKRPIALLNVTPDLIDSGAWPAIGKVRVKAWFLRFPITWLKLLSGRYIVGSGNVRKLFLAWNGIMPWDDFANPRYLNSLLTRGTPIPEMVILRKPNSSLHPDASRR